MCVQAAHFAMSALAGWSAVALAASGGLGAWKLKREVKIETLTAALVGAHWTRRGPAEAAPEPAG